MLSTALRAAAPASPARLQPGAEDLMGLMTFPATIIQADRDEEVIAQSDRLDHCLQVMAGCVRTVCLLEDGRRQVAEFLLPGDLLNLDAIGSETFGAEAVTAVTLRRISHASIEARANTDLAFARRLRAYGAAQARAARLRLVLLGRKTAVERVASFLLEMEDRLGVSPRAGLDLPMSRTDIADYLGLTTETVCRALTELRQAGVIQVQRTRIIVLNHPALERAGCEYVH